MEEIARVFGINWSLLLIQAINFGLVVFILTKFLYKPVLKLLDERRTKVAKGIEDAQIASLEREKAEVEARTIVLSAEKDADKTVSSAKKQAEEKLREAHESAQKQTTQALAEAVKEVENLKARALEESQQEIARLGILAAEKVLKGN